MCVLHHAWTCAPNLIGPGPRVLCAPYQKSRSVTTSCAHYLVANLCIHRRCICSPSASPRKSLFVKRDTGGIRLLLEYILEISDCRCRRVYIGVFFDGNSNIGNFLPFLGRGGIKKTFLKSVHKHKPSAYQHYSGISFICKREGAGNARRIAFLFLR